MGPRKLPIEKCTTMYSNDVKFYLIISLCIFLLFSYYTFSVDSCVSLIDLITSWSQRMSRLAVLICCFCMMERMKMRCAVLWWKCMRSMWSTFLTLLYFQIHLFVRLHSTPMWGQHRGEYYLCKKYHITNIFYISTSSISISCSVYLLIHEYFIFDTKKIISLWRHMWYIPVCVQDESKQIHPDSRFYVSYVQFCLYYHNIVFLFNNFN